MNIATNNTEIIRIALMPSLSISGTGPMIIIPKPLVIDPGIAMAIAINTRINPKNMRRLPITSLWKLNTISLIYYFRGIL